MMGGSANHQKCLLSIFSQQGLKISVTRLPGSSMESPKFQ
ncbi:hypothetical protein BDA96_06G076500 [Sorghum bicolor]|uniref:Uncharacterized protein n=1 Tax=Sorghum bicolor TaxID=4558 RepID=A0A921UCE2_SORBI|nr:hypothetical protein BDA96_06G076500 [Sorghum bicolor]